MRVELVAVDDAERIGLLVEGDRMLLAGRELADDDPRQPVLALEPDEIVLVDDDGDGSAAPRDAGRDRVQLARPGVGDRRGDDLEVLGAAGIGEDVEAVAAMVDVVFLAGPPLGDQHAARPSGVAASMKRTSDVSWSWLSMRM